MQPIGRIIQEELRRQERTVVWLARHLCCDRSNVYDIFKRQTIDCELLFRISTVMEHNFFEDLAKEFSEIPLLKP